MHIKRGSQAISLIGHKNNCGTQGLQEFLTLPFSKTTENWARFSKG